MKRLNVNKVTHCPGAHGPNLFTTRHIGGMTKLRGHHAVLDEIEQACIHHIHSKYTMFKVRFINPHLDSGRETACESPRAAVQEMHIEALLVLIRIHWSTNDLYINLSSTWSWDGSQ